MSFQHWCIIDKSSTIYPGCGGGGVPNHCEENGRGPTRSVISFAMMQYKLVLTRKVQINQTNDSFKVQKLSLRICMFSRLWVKFDIYFLRNCLVAELKFRSNPVSIRSRALIGPQAKRNLDGDSLAGR